AVPEWLVANEFIKGVGEFASVDKLSTVSETNYIDLSGIRSNFFYWVGFIARSFRTWGTLVLRLECWRLKPVHEPGKRKENKYNCKQPLRPILPHRSPAHPLSPLVPPSIHSP